MANSLLDFVMSIVRDPDAAARYAADPSQAIADAHLTDVTSVDVNNLIPVVSESLSMSVPGGHSAYTPDHNVWASGAATYTLTNSRLTGTGIADLTGIQNAVLTGAAPGTTFDLSGWTGTATVIGVGGVNTLVVNRDANFTFTGNTLTVSTGGVFMADGGMSI